MKNKELLLETSYKCNLRCIHCSSVGCKEELGLNDVEIILKNHFLLDEIETVRISGGEPLLNPNLDDYIKFFKDNNIRIILQTNGTATLKEYPILDSIDEIWISFYGEPAIHNFITMDNTYYRVINNILTLQENYSLTIQSAIFNETQLASLLHEIFIFDTNFGLSDNKVKLRLFALLNHGRCNFALPIKEQQKIYNNLFYKYKNTELTCSLDSLKCDYENKLVLKPDGSLFNCASHKHGVVLCKK